MSRCHRVISCHLLYTVIHCYGIQCHLPLSITVTEPYKLVQTPSQEQTLASQVLPCATGVAYDVLPRLTPLCSFKTNVLAYCSLDLQRFFMFSPRVCLELEVLTRTCSCCTRYVFARSAVGTGWFLRPSMNFSSTSVLSTQSMQNTQRVCGQTRSTPSLSLEMHP